MFSYRHAYHAGNHADVLKHLGLIATLRHLTLKDGGLLLVDTHAGAGSYRLDGEASRKSGEAAEGIVRLRAALSTADSAIAPALADYLEVLKDTANGGTRLYPGSPLILHALMRADGRDRLRLFELHPSDARALLALVQKLGAGRRVQATVQDGFESLKALLPPPPDGAGSRRALVLIDPSYEIKSDYARVSSAVQDALRRFPTGVYMVWYPVIPRPEAHALPRRLRTLATQAGRAWLHATLSIGHADGEARQAHPGLSASGLFVLNPPHTLATALRAALPQVSSALARGRGASWQVEAGGTSRPG